MHVVPPLKTRDEKVRLLCHLPSSVLEILRTYSDMLEQEATAAGNPPKRRRGKDAGPAPSTCDHVLEHMITRVLAKEPRFVKWMASRAADQTTAPAPPKQATQRQEAV